MLTEGHVFPPVRRIVQLKVDKRSNGGRLGYGLWTEGESKKES